MVLHWLAIYTQTFLVFEIIPSLRIKITIL
nr:MAG TPA: hypothetical protein [Caudoviricetes sp.]